MYMIWQELLKSQRRDLFKVSNPNQNISQRKAIHNMLYTAIFFLV